MAVSDEILFVNSLIVFPGCMEVLDELLTVAFFACVFQTLLTRLARPWLHGGHRPFVVLLAAWRRCVADMISLACVSLADII